MDIFRIFDSLNYLPNLKVAMEAVQETHALCEAALCYTGDILDPKRDKYSLKYYVKLALELEKMGAHFLAIKDMAGLCRPYAVKKLVKALKEAAGIPVGYTGVELTLLTRDPEHEEQLLSQLSDWGYPVERLD